MTRTERIKNWYQIGFQSLLILTGIAAAVSSQWFNLALASLTLLLTLLPSAIEKRYQINFPNLFELVALLFLSFSLYLGELQNFYLLFPWWDLFIHSLSWLILGTIGMILVNTLNTQKTSIKLSPGFVALFACTFAIALGTAWEIVEFSIDSTFATHMQKSGLVDTMWDLIVDSFGAVTVSLLGYLYLKTDPQFVEKLEKLILHS